MPRKNFSEGILSDCLALYRSLETTGHHLRYGVKDHMARILSYSGETIYRHNVNAMLDILKDRGHIGEHHVKAHPDTGKVQTRGFYQHLTKDRIRDAVNAPKTPRELTITPGVHKILTVPDAHACVHLSNDRFAWLANLCADRKPDCMVQIGDFGSWDSVSTHERPGTVKFSQKPSFETEFAVFHDALTKISLPLRKVMTMGNHEARLYNYEDSNPACKGMMTGRVEGALESLGWEYYPYGMEVFVEGVSFTHKPFNVMGKPKSNSQIRRDLMYDMYTGHDHNKLDEQIPKQGGHVNLISGGVFLPDGYEPSYAKFCTTGWYYGCQILTIENGKIRDTEWISMRTLEEKYGSKS